MKTNMNVEINKAEQDIRVKGEGFELIFFINHRPEGKRLTFSIAYVGDESFRMKDGFLTKYGRGRSKHQARAEELIHEAKLLLIESYGYHF
jgi:hypothetical protein